jgi:hypothetical protein
MCTSWTTDNLFHDIRTSHQLLLLNITQDIFIENSSIMLPPVWLFLPDHPLLPLTFCISTIDDSILPVDERFALVLPTILDPRSVEAPTSSYRSMDVLVGVGEQSAGKFVRLQVDLAVITRCPNLFSGKLV